MSYVAFGAIDCETARHPIGWWVVRSGTKGYDPKVLGGIGYTSRSAGPVPVPNDMWNCLVKQQSDPFLKAATGQLMCAASPSPFVFSDDAQGCVNKNGVTMLTTAASNCKSGSSNWWICTPLVRYMQMNEGKAISDACNAEDVEAGWRFQNLAAAIKRSIEAMEVWRGGWDYVKGSVHGLSRWLNSCSGGHRLEVADLDQILLLSIAVYYDSRRKAWDQILAAEKVPPKTIATSLSTSLLASISSMMKPKTTTAPITSAPKPVAKMNPVAAVAIGMGVAAAAAGGALWYLNKRKRTR